MARALRDRELPDLPSSPVWLIRGTVGESFVRHPRHLVRKERRPRPAVTRFAVATGIPRVSLSAALLELRLLSGMSGGRRDVFLRLLPPSLRLQDAARTVPEAGVANATNGTVSCVARRVRPSL